MADKEATIKIDKNFGGKSDTIDEASSPFPFLSGEGASAMGVHDEDELRAQSELVRHLFNFPADRVLSWTRWKAREIPLIAKQITMIIATNPHRPKNPDGTLKRLLQIYIETLAWLRLAEDGGMRKEAMGGLRTEAEEKTGADAWTDH